MKYKMRSLASRLWQEDEYEDEAKETDTAVEEEGSGVAKWVLQSQETFEAEACASYSTGGTNWYTACTSLQTELQYWGTCID